jgi:hypothetical protein
LGAYGNLMKGLNKDFVFGLDYGHALLLLGLSGYLGFPARGNPLAKTLNTPVLAGLDVGHIALALGGAATLGLGYSKRF